MLSIGSKPEVSLPSKISPAIAAAILDLSDTGRARRVLITCGDMTIVLFIYFWFSLSGWNASGIWCWMRESFMFVMQSYTRVCSDNLHIIVKFCNFIDCVLAIVLWNIIIVKNKTMYFWIIFDVMLSFGNRQDGISWGVHIFIINKSVIFAVGF